MFRLLNGTILLWTFQISVTLAVETEVEAIGVTLRINEEIRNHWRDYEIQPSPRATDGEWTRRVFLDLIGRIPTVKELREYKIGARNGGRRWLVRRLLYDDRYTAEFARNWSTIWTNLLIGRSGGTERNSLIDREGMHEYLRDAFAGHRGYDDMIVDLITAEGTNKPGTTQFDGAVNFLSMKLSEKGTQATADTARIFLGKQVQCTQCHDHPFNDWKQNQFWELNSFFRQAVSLRRFDEETGMISHVELTDQDFAGEGNTPTPDEAELYFEHRDATMQAVYPVFVDGTPLPNRSGRLSEVHRRKELAKFITSSKEMPRAIVNRMWAHFLNHGFTKPVDDMGPHNPPTHPALLDYLAAQFESNGYDLRTLMEWIALSEPYSLSSRITKQNKIDAPPKGEQPLFSHYYMRQLRAEELYDSLITATGADRIENTSDVDQRRRKWLEQFVVALGNDEGMEASTFDGTIAQSLVLFNGELTKIALSEEPSNMLYRLASLHAPFDEKVDHLFLAAVARRSSNTENQAAKQLLQQHGGNAFEGLQDLWWAILNSNEFILNH